MIYAVTGGAGFIGSHLVESLLVAGHQVVVLDDLSTGKAANIPAGVKFIRGDVADHKTVVSALNGCDGCFHLAAIASVERANEDWLGCHRTNLTGTITVLDAARQVGRIPVVYASSAAIYGDTYGTVAVETLPPAPLTAYGADKLGSELHARVARIVHQVPSFGLRFFNVYGPRQDPHSPYSGVISIFASRILGAQKLVIHGDGKQSRDFIYVSDAAAHAQAAMVYLMAGPDQAKVANICTGKATSIKKLALEMMAASGKTSPIEHVVGRRGDIRISTGDNRLAFELLGIKAKMSLRKGLGLTLAHLREAPVQLIAA